MTEIKIELTKDIDDGDLMKFQQDLHRLYNKHKHIVRDIDATFESKEEKNKYFILAVKGCMDIYGKVDKDDD